MRVKNIRIAASHLGSAGVRSVALWHTLSATPRLTDAPGSTRPGNISRIYGSASLAAVVGLAAVPVGQEQGGGLVALAIGDVYGGGAVLHRLAGVDMRGPPVI